MMSRMQVTMPDDLLRLARRRAAEHGVSMAEYIRRLLQADSAPSMQPPPDVRELFNLGASGGSDVARDKDRYLADAVRDRR